MLHDFTAVRCWIPRVTCPLVYLSLHWQISRRHASTSILPHQMPNHLGCREYSIDCTPDLIACCTCVMPKYKGVGAGLKDAAFVVTRVSISLEIEKGTEEMATKAYLQWKKTDTAHVVWPTETLHSTGRNQCWCYVSCTHVACWELFGQSMINIFWVALCTTLDVFS